MILFPWSDGENDNHDNNQQQKNPITSPFPSIQLRLSSNLQLVCTTFNERVRPIHMALDIVEQLTLTLNQNSHIHKNLMQLF